MSTCTFDNFSCQQCGKIKLHVDYATCMLHFVNMHVVFCQHACCKLIIIHVNMSATCMFRYSDMNVPLGCWHVVDVDMHTQGIDIHVTRSKCPFIVSCHRSRDPRLHCVSQWPPLAGPTHNTLASVSHTDSTYTSLAYPQKTCRRA